MTGFASGATPIAQQSAPKTPAEYFANRQDPAKRPSIYSGHSPDQVQAALAHAKKITAEKDLPESAPKMPEPHERSEEALTRRLVGYQQGAKPTEGVQLALFPQAAE